MPDNKDVPETRQPAYDDYQTRMLLVQVLPNAPLSELEAKRAWIAGETPKADVAGEVRKALTNIPGSSPQDMRFALNQIAMIVEYRA